MSAFEDITLSWGDKEYVVPANRVMGAIGRIERIVTLTEINRMATNGGAFELTRISSAYASVLRYAGCENLKDEDVYLGMFAEGQTQAAIMGAVSGLLAMMVPPIKDVTPAGKPQGQAPQTAASLSKKPSKRRSATGA